MNQAQICEILTSGQVIRLDVLQPYKFYANLRAQELFLCGCEARILMHIWDYLFRDGYVILPFHVLSRNDINQINNYTKIMKFVYRGVDSSSDNPMVDFI